MDASVSRALLWRLAAPVAVLVVARLAWLMHKRRNRITFDEGSAVTSAIVKAIKSSIERYDSVAWLPSGVLQTVWTELAAVPSLRFKRDKLVLAKMEDHADEVDHTVCRPKVIPEGEVSVDWLAEEEAEEEGMEPLAEDAPVVLLVPGLTGDSSSGYVRRVARYLHRGESGTRFRVCCYNPRGRGGNEVKTPLLYCVGFTADLKRVVAHVQSARPRSKVFAAGFSLGSNYLAKFVGEEGDGCQLAGAACLACPIDCLSISNMLQGTLVGRTIMDPVLVRSVQRVREEYEHLLRDDPRFDLERMKRAKTMHEFDGAVIAPMFEFSSASAYYRWSSSGLFLDQIRRPTLFVHAQNDPIVNAGSVKLDDFRQSPWLINVMTREGGHGMDWFLPDGSPWIAQAVGQFFAAASNVDSCNKQHAD